MKNNSKSIVSLIYGNFQFLKFNEGICKKYKSADIAMLIGIFAELEEYFNTNHNFETFMKKSGGYFFCMAKFVTERNGMSPDRMRRAVKIMEEKELIFTKKWAKNWKLFKINHDKLLKVLSEIAVENLERQKKNGKDISSKVDRLESDLETLNNVLLKETLN